MAEALDLGEYHQRKNTLVAERKTIDEKLSEVAGKGHKWLELMREWILKANEPVAWQNQETPPRMREFLGSIGSNRRITGGQLSMDLPHPWDSLAALRVGAQRGVQIPVGGPGENRTRATAMRMRYTTTMLQAHRTSNVIRTYALLGKPQGFPGVLTPGVKEKV